ncbi:unnamed protein product [Symbiodinium microadriaticum]|nr:unnamed protein product [Symbiodinium microadriaticum]
MGKASVGLGSQKPVWLKHEQFMKTAKFKANESLGKEARSQVAAKANTRQFYPCEFPDPVERWIGPVGGIMSRLRSITTRNSVSQWCRKSPQEAVLQRSKEHGTRAVAREAASTKHAKEPEPPELTTAQARNARRARRRAAKRVQDDDEFEQVQEAEFDHAFEAQSIRQQPCSAIIEDVQVGELLPNQVEDPIPNQAVPESWEDLEDVDDAQEDLPLPETLLAMCCGSYHDEDCGLHIDEGTFVRTRPSQAKGNMAFVEDLEDPTCWGYLPADLLEIAFPGYVWAKVLHSPKLIQLPDQLEVRVGRFVLLDMESEKDGWIRAEEPLSGLSGRIKRDWLDLNAVQ